VVSRKDRDQVTGAQLRAARVLLDITIASLAEKTGLGERTIKRAEQGDDEVRLTTANEKLLVSALEELGAVFIPANGGGAGVRLRSSQKRAPLRAAKAPSKKTEQGR
jgi:transcriptional regulator with XRE-family HTH domain